MSHPIDVPTLEAGLTRTLATLGFRESDRFELAIETPMPSTVMFTASPEGKKEAASWILSAQAQGSTVKIGVNPLRRELDPDAAPDLAVSCVRALPIVAELDSSTSSDVARQVVAETLGLPLPMIVDTSRTSSTLVCWLVVHEPFLPEAGADPRRDIRQRIVQLLGVRLEAVGARISPTCEALRARIPVIGAMGVSLEAKPGAVWKPTTVGELERVVSRLAPAATTGEASAEDDDDDGDAVETPSPWAQAAVIDDPTPEDLAAVRAAPTLAAIWDEAAPSDPASQRERDVRFAVELLRAGMDAERLGRLVAGLPGGAVAEQQQPALVLALVQHAARLLEKEQRERDLAEARKLLETLPKAVQEDPTAPFEEQALSLMRRLRADDKAAFGKLKALLRAQRVSIRDLDAAIGAESEPSVSPDAKGSAATRIISLAGEADLFHSPDLVAYASVPVADHRETWPVKARGFRTWLARRYFAQYGMAVSGQAMSDAVLVLEGQAIFEGVARPVFTRVATHDGAVYVDLGDENWRAIRITPVGWCIVDDPPVRFRRSRGLLPLPEPMRGGSLDELFSILNVPEGPPRTLLAGWLVASLRPTPPYLILVIQGEQGSGKSTATKLCKSVIDPNTAALRAPPREERDLMIAAKNGWCLAYDNLSGIPPWISDALCRLSTGGALSTRELYTDDDEVLLEATRPSVINGIDDLLERADLADRAVMIPLPTISPERRRPERQIIDAFAAAHPRILGALCDAVAMALRRVGQVRLETLPRMADVAQWVTAAEPALGIAQGEFVAAFVANRGEAVQIALEADPVAAEVRRLMERTDGWEGSAAQLLADLNRHVSERISREKGWPRLPQSLSNRLKRLAPALREIGIEVTFDRVGRGGDRVIRLMRLRT